MNYPYTVSSPTFTLVNSYEADYNVIHADFYREPNIDRWNDFGFRELIYKNDIVLVEWADLIPDILPEDTIFIKDIKGCGLLERTMGPLSGGPYTSSIDLFCYIIFKEKNIQFNSMCYISLCLLCKYNYTVLRFHIIL